MVIHILFTSFLGIPVVECACLNPSGRTIHMPATGCSLLAVYKKGLWRNHPVHGEKNIVREEEATVPVLPDLP